MFTYKKVITLTLLLAASFGAAFAQNNNKPALHPGDTLKYSLRIDSSDAEKFRFALMSLNLSTPPREGQTTFQSTVQTGWVSRGTDHLFQLVLTVPQFAATGDYPVSLILAVDLNGSPRFSYEPSELSVPTVHIVNDGEIHKPKVVLIPQS